MILKIIVFIPIIENYEKKILIIFIVIFLKIVLMLMNNDWKIILYFEYSVVKKLIFCFCIELIISFFFLLRFLNTFF